MLWTTGSWLGGQLVKCFRTLSQKKDIFVEEMWEAFALKAFHIFLTKNLGIFQIWLSEILTYHFWTTGPRSLMWNICSLYWPDVTTLSFYWNFPVVIYLYGEVVLVAACSSPDIVSVQNRVLPASAVVSRPQRGDLIVSVGGKTYSSLYCRTVPRAQLFKTNDVVS